MDGDRQPGPDVVVPNLDDDEAGAGEQQSDAPLVAPNVGERQVVPLALNLDDDGKRLVAKVDTPSPSLAPGVHLPAQRNVGLPEIFLTRLSSPESGGT